MRDHNRMSYLFPTWVTSPISKNRLRYDPILSHCKLQGLPAKVEVYALNRKPLMSVIADPKRCKDLSHEQRFCRIARGLPVDMAKSYSAGKRCRAPFVDRMDPLTYATTTSQSSNNRMPRTPFYGRPALTHVIALEYRFQSANFRNIPKPYEMTRLYEIWNPVSTLY